MLRSFSRGLTTYHIAILKLTLSSIIGLQLDSSKSEPSFEDEKRQERYKIKNDQNRKLKDKGKKRPKTDDTWASNISFRPLDYLRSENKGTPDHRLSLRKN